ncbi:MAG: N-acetylmuramoyl-L-alanine amidase [Selenomonadaceae bacterium]|nr:N-acetylmuramoyl-L-alanine amidase [Selenomonadaceae bacterium]
MLKKFLTCFTLLLALTFVISSTALAKSAELMGIDASNLDDETLQIKIAYRGEMINSGSVATELKSGILSVELDNASPGRISRIAGAQIKPNAREYIDKIFVNGTKDSRTNVKIYLHSLVNDTDVDVSVDPTSQSDKNSKYLFINLKKNNTQDNYTYNGDGKVVVIDPGHGGSDAGAIGPNGTKEKTVSLDVSLKARDLLVAAGYNVIMTHETDTDVAAPGVSDGVELQARVDKTPPNTDIFISVHCNAFANSRANGMETYYAPGAVQGAKLAQVLNEELDQIGEIKNRGVKPARFYVMTHSKCPSSLIELGFITNYREEQLLSSNDYQDKLAQAIARAVNRYFNQGGFD